MIQLCGQLIWPSLCLRWGSKFRRPNLAMKAPYVFSNSKKGGSKQDYRLCQKNYNLVFNSLSMIDWERNGKVLDSFFYTHTLFKISNSDNVGVNLEFELPMRLLWLFQERAELLCWRKQNPEISTSRSGKGWLYIWRNTGRLYCLVKSAKVFKS